MVTPYLPLNGKTTNPKKRPDVHPKWVYLRLSYYMIYTIEPVEHGKKWTVVSNESNVGTVERLSTGYLVTLTGASVGTDSPKIVKRFRMIDALKEALGDQAEITIPE